MATPFFQIQGGLMTLTPGSPGSLRVLTKDNTGAAIDVSSGFTVKSFDVIPAADFNTDKGTTSISADVTPTFDTTGVTFNWTGAQASTMSSLLATLHGTTLLYLSNDGGTTGSMALSGPLLVNNLNGAI